MAHVEIKALILFSCGSTKLAILSDQFLDVQKEKRFHILKAIILLQIESSLESLLSRPMNIAQ